MSMRLGLIGHPVSHSLSPPMHRAAFLSFGIAGTYELIDIKPEDLPLQLERLVKEGFAGFNVTIPHKEAVYRLVTARSIESELVGAVNTVKIDSSMQLSAHNTDLGGFRQALEQALSFHCLSTPEKALVLGAGGAARSCLSGLLLSGCKKLYLAARRVDEAECLVKSICAKLSVYMDRISCDVSVISFDSIEGTGEYPLLLNCTSVGLKDGEEAPDWARRVIDSVQANGLLFDTVYKKDRSPTLLMELARARGLNAVDGINMLVEQAVLSFEFWTGRRPGSKLMHDALLLN